MRILVTGGGGFVGRAVARELREAGHTPRLFGRSPQPGLAAEGYEVVQGDLADAAAVAGACTGCEAVMHVAAKAGVWGLREEYWRANVLGTRHVLAGCRQAGVRHLVYTSTPSVVFTGRSLAGADESLPYGRRFLCDYAETKAVAEREVLTAHQPPTLSVCALRPHLIFGPGDPHLLPAVVAAARAGRLAIIGRGRNRVDITHVANVALAHRLALEALVAGRAGGRAYFLSQGEPVALWPWLNEVLTGHGLPPLRRRVPFPVAYAAGALAEAVWRAGRRPGVPPMTRFVAVELSHDHWFDISAARRDLGYAPRVSTADGLADYLRSRA